VRQKVVGHCRPHRRRHPHHAQRPENLSAGAPRKAEDIEKLMAEKSVLNDWQLPKVE
jgi:hypothetical protein